MVGTVGDSIAAWPDSSSSSLVETEPRFVRISALQCAMQMLRPAAKNSCSNQAASSLQHRIRVRSSMFWKTRAAFRKQMDSLRTVHAGEACFAGSSAR